MSGAGNDFIVVELAEWRAAGGSPVEWARSLCRRGVSIGSDGLLVLESLGDDRVRVAFYNPDGTPAFCGNGSRCAARYAHLKGMAGDRLRLETDWGEVPARIVGERVELHLPPPEDRGQVEVPLGTETVTGRFIEAGVPHFVIPVSRAERAPLERWGPALRRHARFGEAGVNVDLVGPVQGGEAAIRTWERGVEGETLACGSGALAAAHSIRLAGGGETVGLIPKSGRTIEVSLPGPPERPDHARLVGDARVIFEGEVDPEAWAE
jgi:diaminopimelate epimerase